MTGSTVPARTAMRRLGAASLPAMLLLVSGCTAATPTLAPSETARGALQSFYAQELSWESCDVRGFECTEVEVPLDYADPAGETITLAVNRHAASGHSQGVLFFNPGGPGGSAYDYALTGLSYFFGDALIQGFDIISVDPRGVQNSSPITCFTDSGQKDALLYDELESTPGTPEYTEEVRAAIAAFGEGCLEHTGALLGHVDTLSAARDLDIVRAALRVSTVNMLGFSYGTLLGATYAGLFPDRVGRFVLDGAEDPSLSGFELLYGQLVGLDTAIRAYLADCLTDLATCPFTGTVETAAAQLGQFFDDLDGAPLTASDGRIVSSSLAVGAVTSSMYTPWYQWPQLSAAIVAAREGDPSGILAIQDESNGRNDDGSYSDNSLEAFYAVMCVDYPLETDVTVLAEQQQLLRDGSDILGRFYADGTQMCDGWPAAAARTPAEITAAGSGPILVIGNTGDPVTPLIWAQALAAQLDNAALLTNDEVGHTAYNAYASTCVREAVENFLIDGTEVADGAECAA